MENKGEKENERRGSTKECSCCKDRMPEAVTPAVASSSHG